jgi:F0F1-type ATP synthase membrane subunit a
MNGNEHASGMRHLIGLALAVLAIVVIALFWSYGLDYLNGTVFEELRYVIFVVFVIGLLSGLQNLIVRIMD